MKRVLTSFYAVLCMLVMLAGFVFAFFFAWKRSTVAVIWCLAGFLLGWLLSPFFHEIGHAAFGKAQKMRLEYLKFFCFGWVRKEGKLRMFFASPFAAEQTQTIPLCHGNMKTRMIKYTAGGLIVSGVQILLFLALGILLIAFDLAAAFFFFAALPYTVYLFMLNALPLYLPSGKTDALIIKGIQKQNREETAVINAMEIFGYLSEGKSFSEIDEELYLHIPVVAEDEPVFAVVADLKYRYYLEKGDFEKAAEWINRLASVSPYLTDEKTEEVAAELSYMHTLNGDFELAKQTREIAENFFKANGLSSLRISAAYFAASGDKEQAALIKKEALHALKREDIVGKRKAEELLLSRIS